MKLAQFFIILFIISVPIITVLGAFRCSAFDNELAGFLKGNGDISAFTQEEQEHLIEVREVMQGFLFVLYAGVLILIVSGVSLYFADKKKFVVNIGKALFYGGISTVGLVVVLSLLWLNFDWMFAAFHKMLFETQWQFPADSLLIQMFPQAFFVNMLMRILTISLIIGIAVGTAGFFIKQKIYKQSSNSG
ncbi:DUF1461 domain-containing protein [Candidatus Woesearchaeota archaeon]|nr:DUF1461 domain-containing protein [Candidatus Woesearchaeota archaeon]